jgi:hypothetical protein
MRRDRRIVSTSSLDEEIFMANRNNQYSRGGRSGGRGSNQDYDQGRFQSGGRSGSEGGRQ